MEFLDEFLQGKGVSTMLRILWGLVVLLVVLWLIGSLIHFAGSVIHVLLVIAVIVLIYNLFAGGRFRRRR
jgi:hypothetical protein